MLGWTYSRSQERCTSHLNEAEPATPGHDSDTRANILGLLATGPRSRAEIATALELSPATVTTQTRRLVRDGLMRELPGITQGAGRPKIPLELIPGALNVVGISVSTHELVVVTTGLDGAMMRNRTVAFDPGRDPIPQLARACAEEIQANKTLPGPTAAVGISISGAVDSTNSTVLLSATLGWQGLELGRTLSAQLGVPVFVENDMASAATSELNFGIGRFYRSFLLLGLGDGVGLGIVHNRKVFQGPDGASTEFGHMPVSTDGRRCRCGNFGCIQAYAGLDEMLSAAPVGVRSLAELRTLAMEGNGDIRGYLAATGELLGRSIGSVVNLLGIRNLLVAGESAVLWRFMEAGFKLGSTQTLLPHTAPLQIEVRPWLMNNPAVGAANLALHKMLGLGHPIPSRKRKPDAPDPEFQET